MCGIAGYYSFGKYKPSKVILESILTKLQVRGTDATGVAFIDKNNKLKVIKNNNRAVDFISFDSDWNELLEEDVPSYMIMHTRAATKGCEKNNKNNHPIYRNGLAIIHNGIISNDDDLYEEYKFKRDGEVDSEIILALLEKDRDKSWTERIKNINSLLGNFAVAAIDTKLPNTLCLFRHSSPIVLAIDEEKDIMYFASTKKILEESIYHNYRGIVDITNSLVFTEIKNDNGIIIDENGVCNSFSLSITDSYKYYGKKSWKYNKNNNKLQNLYNHDTNLKLYNKDSKSYIDSSPCSTCIKPNIRNNKGHAECEGHPGIVSGCSIYERNPNTNKQLQKKDDEYKDLCSKCKLVDVCFDATIFNKLDAKLYERACLQINDKPILLCSDCIFDSGCVRNSKDPLTCDNFKYKELESITSFVCKDCLIWETCNLKFIIADNDDCGLFELNTSRKEQCEFGTICTKDCEKTIIENMCFSPLYGSNLI